MERKRDRAGASSDAEEQAAPKRAKAGGRFKPIADYRQYVAQMLRKAPRRGPPVPHPEHQLVFGRSGHPTTYRLYKIQMGPLSRSGPYAHVAESRMAIFAELCGFHPGEPLFYDLPGVADKIPVADEAEWSILLETLQDVGVPMTAHCSALTFYVYFEQDKGQPAVKPERRDSLTITASDAVGGPEASPASPSSSDSDVVEIPRPGRHKSATRSSSAGVAAPPAKILNGQDRPIEIVDDPYGITTDDPNLADSVQALADGMFGTIKEQDDPKNETHLHKMPGLLFALRPSQRRALAFVFKSMVDGPLHGCIIAHGVGSGKTLIGIAWAVICYGLAAKMEEVERSRQAADGNHLMPSVHGGFQQARDQSCPSGDFANGYMCPCREGFLPNRVMRSGTLVAGPAMIVLPPHLLSQWVTRAFQYLDNASMPSGLRAMEVWDYGSSSRTKIEVDERVVFQGHSEKKKGGLKTIGEAGLSLRGHDIIPPPALAHVVQLMPYSMITQHAVDTEMYDYANANETVSFPDRPSKIFFDEAHLRVSKESETWKFFEKITVESAVRVPIVICTATPTPSSAKNIDAFIQVTLRKNPKGKSFKKQVANWFKKAEWCEAHSSKAFSEDPVVATAFGQQLTESKMLKLKVLKSIMHREVIRDRPPVAPTRIECPIPRDAGKFVVQLAKETEEEINERLQKRLDAWDGHGDAPTVNSILNLSRPASGRFLSMILSSVFPMAARYLIDEDEDVTVRELFRTNRKEHQVLKSRAKFSLQDAKASRYWPYIEQIAPDGGSMKLSKIMDLIQLMRKDCVRLPDGTTRQCKMIVWCDRPLTLHWMALALRNKIQDLAMTVVTSSSTDAQRSLLTEPFRRALHEPDPAGDPEVLLSSPALLGTGVDLVRASYMVFSAPLPSDQEAQAVGRMDREGNYCENLHVSSLETRGNPVDGIVSRRNHVRSEMLSLNIELDSASPSA